MELPYATADREKTDPDVLIRHYIVIGLISMIAVLSFSCYGIYRAYLSRIITNAEDSAVGLAGALMDHEKDNLLSRAGDGSSELRVTSSNFSQIDKSFRQFLAPFGIVKIKVYDRNARIIYSTDATLVGKVDKDNKRLANALAGKNDSEAVKKDKVLDLQGQQKFDVDVVEAYIPVRDGQGKIIGSFELYQDITRYYREISRFVMVSGAIILIVLSSVFLVSFVLLRKEAIQLKAVQDALKNQANTDFLTGISNRRQLLVRCEEEMSRLKRMKEMEKVPCTIGFIMVDIDHFKKINDTYGHAAGDEVIRELASRLRNSLRQHDVLGRYGGEEFLVVLPQTATEQLTGVAERLWKSVRSKPFQYGSQSMAVTISLGVAASSSLEESHEEIIRRADSALYCSKNEGRDRISYA